MKIIALSDLHGQTAALPRVENELAAADLVVLSGDITHFGDAQAADAAIAAIRAYNTHLVAITGNCDNPECENALEQAGIALNCRNVVLNNLNFIGLSGSLPCPNHTPNEAPDDLLAQRLDAAAQQRDQRFPTVLVCHQPPFDTAADRVLNGAHVGSPAIRAFIERVQPLICFTGHIHEARSISRLGPTTIVNPGPWAAGNYAAVNIVNGGANVELRFI